MVVISVVILLLLSLPIVPRSMVDASCVKMLISSNIEPKMPEIATMDCVLPEKEKEREREGERKRESTGQTNVLATL